jgi:hypothetical protein
MQWTCVDFEKVSTAAHENSVLLFRKECTSHDDKGNKKTSSASEEFISPPSLRTNPYMKFSKSEIVNVFQYYTTNTLPHAKQTHGITP